MAQGDGLPKERFDDIDRVQSPAASKLVMLCEMTKNTVGQDPRGGGWSFVGDEAVVAALLRELPPLMRTLRPKFMVDGNDGRGDSDVVCDWNGVPIRLRLNAVGGRLHALKNIHLPASKQEDRIAAGQMRVAAWAAQAS